MYLSDLGKPGKWENHGGRFHVHTFSGYLLQKGVRLSTMETTPHAAGSMGLEENWETFQGALLHGEESAWGLGGSWHLATLQLVVRGAGGGGVGLRAVAGLWAPLLPPGSPSLLQKGAQGGWQAPGRQRTRFLGENTEQRKGQKNNTNS